MGANENKEDACPNAHDLSELLMAAKHAAVAERHIEKGDYAAAESELTAAVTIKEDLLGKDHLALLPLLHDLGLVCHAQDKYKMAESILGRALLIGAKRLGRLHADVREVEKSLADVRNDQDAYAHVQPSLLVGGGVAGARRYGQ